MYRYIDTSRTNVPSSGINKVVTQNVFRSVAKIGLKSEVLAYEVRDLDDLVPF